MLVRIHRKNGWIGSNMALVKLFVGHVWVHPRAIPVFFHREGGFFVGPRDIELDDALRITGRAVVRIELAHSHTCERQHRGRRVSGPQHPGRRVELIQVPMQNSELGGISTASPASTGASLSSIAALDQEKPQQRHQTCQ